MFIAFTRDIYIDRLSPKAERLNIYNLKDVFITIALARSKNTTRYGCKRTSKGGKRRVKATILGKRKVNFTADDGRTIIGTTVWLGFDDESDVEGMYCEKTFISNAVEAYKDIEVGTDVEVSYNSRGKVVGIN